jgi:hypothetical protein
MLALILFAFTVFINTITFEPKASLEDAWRGPGSYYWKVEFGPHDVVHSGVSLDEKPKDWQPLYDEHWQIVAPWAVRMGYPVPNDGCWLDHTCPPMMIHMAEVGTNNPLEPIYYFLVYLLRSH